MDYNVHDAALDAISDYVDACKREIARCTCLLNKEGVTEQQRKAYEITIKTMKASIRYIEGKVLKTKVN
jgi:hypothetical protein